MSLSFLFLVAFLLMAFLAFSIPNRGLFKKLAPRPILLHQVSKAKNQSKSSAHLELPDFICILWFLVSAGEQLHTALRITVDKSRGYVSEEFSKLIQRVEHGGILQHELENLAAETGSDQVRELATKLAVSLSNGTPVADQLSELANSANSTLRSSLLERAGKNETKMMIPLIFVILPVTVMFALYPSTILLRNSFI